MRGKPTTLGKILTAIADQIATAAKYPAQSVFITMSDDDTLSGLPGFDRIAAIRPADFPVLSAGVSGGGRATTGFDGGIQISILTRLGSDQELRDTKRLTDRTLGAIAQSAKVIDALQLFDPKDDSDIIVREPMRLLRMSFSSVKASTWMVTRTTWQALFNQELSQ